MIASNILKGPDTLFEADIDEFIESVRRALYTSKICSYAQGFALMRSAAEQYNWNLQYGEIAKIFRGGCIIRANLPANLLQAQRDYFGAHTFERTDKEGIFHHDWMSK